MATINSEKRPELSLVAEAKSPDPNSDEMNESLRAESLIAGFVKAILEEGENRK